MSARQEVKGTAFVTLRQWIRQERGEDAWRRLLDALDEPTRDAVSEPLPSEWHAEAAHHDVLRALHHTLAEGSEARFQSIITGATGLGISKFAQVVLRMGSPRFVGRRCPALWRVLRRGPAYLEVEETPARLRLVYHDFGFFEDALYRDYIVALLRAVMRPSVGRVPDVRIVDPTPTRLVVDLGV